MRRRMLGLAALATLGLSLAALRAGAGETIRLPGGRLRLEEPGREGPVLSASDRRFLASGSAAGTVDVFVETGPRLPWAELDRLLETARVPLAERPRQVLEALVAVSARKLERARAELLPLLEPHGLLAGEPRALPVHGWVLIPTLRRGVDLLARDPRVLHLELAPPPDQEIAPEVVPAIPDLQEGAPWGPAGAGAEQAWRLGLCGTGRLVALLDGGWDERHEALRDRFRGTLPSAPPPRPGNHGTAVLSAALGLRPDRTPLGPAFEAGWIATDPFPRGIYEPLVLEAAAHWLLERAPDVVLLPWVSGRTDPGALRPVLSALRTAGIAVVAAAGNTGPRPGANAPPANLSPLGPDGAPALAVAAVRRDHRLYAFSARGPSETGALFPGLSAPGARLLAATDSPGGYGVVDGTSFAAGVAAGSLALLRQAAPDIPGPDLERLLVDTACDLGDPGPDLEHGAGLVDVAAALAGLGLGPRRLPGAEP